MDVIDVAREAMESADDAYEQYTGHCDAVLDELAQAVADAEAAYYRACEDYAPAYAPEPLV